ncbi:MAG: glycosyltransferase [Rhodospirillales bacterium]
MTRQLPATTCCAASSRSNARCWRAPWRTPAAARYFSAPIATTSPRRSSPLHSLSRVTDRDGTDFFIVLDDALVDVAERGAAAFRRAGFSVAIVPASSVVASAEKLYPAYGLFTSGHVLSSAAYYRIYFAKYLAGLNVYERAVYVDSDVLVRGTLDPLFASDLGGRPLAARLEPMRPEVRRAIALHRLQDDRYFNSGVLLFDLRHERLAANLDGAGRRHHGRRSHAAVPRSVRAEPRFQKRFCRPRREVE